MKRIATGIRGLDEVLKGGWLGARAYVVCGGPGTGKTTMGMHFLSADPELGDARLFVSFDESERQTRADAQALGLSLQNVAFLDLTPEAETFRQMQTYDIFTPAEVQKDPITRLISDTVDQIRPVRLFIDGFSQFGHLAGDAFHLRRLVQSCFRFATERGATVLVSCDCADPRLDRDIQSAADGVAVLETVGSLRRLRVLKLRGSAYEAGAHMMRLTDAGMVVFPSAA